MNFSKRRLFVCELQRADQAPERLTGVRCQLLIFDKLDVSASSRMLGVTLPPNLLARADEAIKMKQREYIALIGRGAAALFSLQYVPS